MSNLFYRKVIHKVPHIAVSTSIAFLLPVSDSNINIQNTYFYESVKVSFGALGMFISRHIGNWRLSDQRVDMLRQPNLGAAKQRGSFVKDCPDHLNQTVSVVIEKQSSM